MWGMNSGCWSLLEELSVGSVDLPGHASLSAVCEKLEES